MFKHYAIFKGFCLSRDRKNAHPLKQIVGGFEDAFVKIFLKNSAYSTSICILPHYFEGTIQILAAFRVTNNGLFHSFFAN